MTFTNDELNTIWWALSSSNAACVRFLSDDSRSVLMPEHVEVYRRLRRKAQDLMRKIEEHRHASTAT